MFHITRFHFIRVQEYRLLYRGLSNIRACWVNKPEKCSIAFVIYNKSGSIKQCCKQAEIHIHFIFWTKLLDCIFIVILAQRLEGSIRLAARSIFHCEETQSESKYAEYVVLEVRRNEFKFGCGKCEVNLQLPCLIEFFYSEISGVHSSFCLEK